MTVVSSVSFLGSLSVCTIYMVMKNFRNFALKIVMYLCFSDLIAMLAVIIYPPPVFKDVIVRDSEIIPIGINTGMC